MIALKRLKAASEASSNKATQISAKTIFSKRLIYFSGMSTENRSDASNNSVASGFFLLSPQHSALSSISSALE